MSGICERLGAKFPGPTRLIVLNEASLYRHVKSFLAYYHESRTHLSAGIATRAPAGTRSRGYHTASWRTSPPLRATRSLNAALPAAIPTPGQVFQILASRYDKAPLFANRSVTSRASRLFPEKMPETSDLRAGMHWPPTAPPARDGICGRHRAGITR